MKKPRLAIVVPCYNESEVLPATAEHLFTVLNRLKKQQAVAANSFVAFVDDGSQDDTWKLILALKRRYKFVQGLKLSRNFGHQNALLAGLLRVQSEADCAISIDGDLQQDENAIAGFLEKFHEGYDIIYGVRKNRSSDTWFKRLTANFFYTLMHIMGVKVINNHADYRLVSKKVLGVLAEHKEVMLFLRGIFTTMGFKTAVVYHDVKERYAGKSKYSLHKMLSFALNGITSFSFTPIRFVSALGVALVLGCGLLGIVFLWLLHCGQLFSPRAFFLLAVYFLGGVQLVCLGVIGEYVGKIYVEVKKRPRYIVEEEI